MSDVTVVISNYNYIDYLPAAIDSCLVQSIPCRIIVVDDASTDGSWGVIRQYASRGITGIRLKQNSGGNSRGKNVGIALCETPYVICLDSDDMLLPNSIELRQAVLSSTPEVDFVHGCAIRFWSTDSYHQCLIGVQSRVQHIIAMSGFQNPESIPPNDICWYRGIAASTVMARTILYQKYGLYDEACGKEDREMWYRWLSHGVRRGYIHQNVSIYRNHDRQITRHPERKRPQEVDAYFAKIIETRRNISIDNTLMMSEFKPGNLIAERI